MVQQTVNAHDRGGLKPRGFSSHRIGKNLRKRNRTLHLMLLPGVILIFIYRYIPMGGVIIAFQNFIPAKGFFGDQEWIGLENFKFILELPDTYRILRNTLFIAFMKIIGNLAVPIAVAILLNEMRTVWLKRGIQTLIYLPHFLSWVILGGIFMDVLSPQSGIFNELLSAFGIKPVFFLGDKTLFPYVMAATDIWKEFGYGTILYLAAITTIDPSLYESAVMDGAGRWKQIWYITLPGMMTIIVVLATLSLGRVLNAGFEQILNLYSPVVYETGDIIDTFVYRMGLVNAQYSFATAIGLFKSVVSTTLVVTSYYMAYRIADYRIF